MLLLRDLGPLYWVGRWLNRHRGYKDRRQGVETKSKQKRSSPNHLQQLACAHCQPRQEPRHTTHVSLQVWGPSLVVNSHNSLRGQMKTKALMGSAWAKRTRPQRNLFQPLLPEQGNFAHYSRIIKALVRMPICTDIAVPASLTKPRKPPCSLGDPDGPVDLDKGHMSNSLPRLGRVTSYLNTLDTNAWPIFERPRILPSDSFDFDKKHDPDICCGRSRGI